MNRSIFLAFLILVFVFSIIALTKSFTSKSYQAIASRKIEYKVVEAGGEYKLESPKHMERLLNVMSEEGWQYLNVIPMTDLVIFKK